MGVYRLLVGRETPAGDGAWARPSRPPRRRRRRVSRSCAVADRCPALSSPAGVESGSSSPGPARSAGPSPPTSRCTTRMAADSRSGSPSSDQARHPPLRDGPHRVAPGHQRRRSQPGGHGGPARFPLAARIPRAALPAPERQSRVSERRSQSAALERTLEAEAAKRLGLETDFFVRSAAEWADDRRAQSVPGGSPARSGASPRDVPQACAPAAARRQGAAGGDHGAGDSFAPMAERPTSSTPTASADHGSPPRCWRRSSAPGAPDGTGTRSSSWRPAAQA